MKTRLHDLITCRYNIQSLYKQSHNPHRKCLGLHPSICLWVEIIHRNHISIRMHREFIHIVKLKPTNNIEHTIHSSTQTYISKLGHFRNGFHTSRSRIYSFALTMVSLVESFIRTPSPSRVSLLLVSLSSSVPFY